MANTNDPGADAEFRERLRRYEERTHPHYALQFDGSKLTLQENDEPIISWPAVWGRQGTQGPEYQSYRDHDPLPQGSYRAKVSKMQHYDDTSTLDRLAGVFDRGTWRGGTTAWGNHRASRYLCGAAGVAVDSGKHARWGARWKSRCRISGGRAITSGGCGPISNLAGSVPSQSGTGARGRTRCACIGRRARRCNASATTGICCPRRPRRGEPASRLEGS